MVMPWTGELVGKLHNAGITHKEFAAFMGMHEKSVSYILNGKRNPKNAEKKFNEAFARMVEQKGA